MDKKIFFKWSLRDLLVALGPFGIGLIVLIVVGALYIDPAPPNHFTIAAGADEEDLQQFAKEYAQLLKEDGVRLDVQMTDGPFDNLHKLEDENAHVQAAFVQDGLGSTEKQPDVVSLGSLSYQPIWLFYRGKEINFFNELAGKRISMGRKKHGTYVLARRLMKMNGVPIDDKNIAYLSPDESLDALEKGTIDAAFMMQPPESPVLDKLMNTPGIHLFNDQQAEAIARVNPSFHHLILPRGAIDLKTDQPRQDINILATTTTLLVRDDLHPGLAFLLMKAAAQLHKDPGVFEKRDEFPSNKDDAFPLSTDATRFFKSGGTIWQRYLPYWLAAWVSRFIFLVIPFLAIAIPTIQTAPKIYFWRIRRRVYHRYGELKFLETQIGTKLTTKEYEDFLTRLDAIEDRVNKIQVPRNFADYIYSVRGHIQFVRDRLHTLAEASGPTTGKAQEKQA